MDKSAMIRGAILAMQVDNSTKTELFKYLDNLEGYEAAQERYEEYKEEL